MKLFSILAVALGLSFTGALFAAGASKPASPADAGCCTPPAACCLPAASCCK